MKKSKHSQSRSASSSSSSASSSAGSFSKKPANLEEVKQHALNFINKALKILQEKKTGVLDLVEERKINVFEFAEDVKKLKEYNNNIQKSKVGEHGFGRLIIKLKAEITHLISSINAADHFVQASDFRDGSIMTLETAHELMANYSTNLAEYAEELGKDLGLIYNVYE